MTFSSSSNSPIRILVVDDHALLREGLASLIAKQNDMQVCGEAEDEETALQLTRELRPRVMVIDISLKQGNGIDLVKQVAAHHPQVRVLVNSMHDEMLFAERALQAGAMGYVSKQEDPRRLIEGIRSIAAGNIFLSDKMSRRLLSRLATGRPAGEASPIDSLTDRELQVFHALGDGLTVRQIAKQLDLSPKTIERYRENLKKKLNLASASELLRYATQWALRNT